MVGLDFVVNVHIMVYANLVVYSQSAAAWLRF